MRNAMVGKGQRRDIGFVVGIRQPTTFGEAFTTDSLLKCPSDSSQKST